MHSLEHRIDSTLQRFQSLPIDFRPREKLQPAICECWREPMLPEMNSFRCGTKGGTPVWKVKCQQRQSRR